MTQLVAVLDRLSPISATIGPMMTGGMSLFTQPDPVDFTMIAMTTYTRPANTQPRISP